MNTFTTLMREFPSLAAVPDFHSVEAVPQLPYQEAVSNSFGEFQEVSLQAVPAVPSPPSPATRDSSPPLVLSAREREEIVGELLGRDISSLVLTPLQRLAIIQENRARERGFPPFSPASDKKPLPSSSFAGPHIQQSGRIDSDRNAFKSQNQIQVIKNDSSERFRSPQVSRKLTDRPKPFKRPALTFLPTENEKAVKRGRKPTSRSKNRIRIKLKNTITKDIADIPRSRTPPKQQAVITQTAQTRLNSQATQTKVLPLANEVNDIPRSRIESTLKIVNQADFQTNFKSIIPKLIPRGNQPEQDRFQPKNHLKERLPVPPVKANSLTENDLNQPRRLNQNFPPRIKLPAPVTPGQDFSQIESISQQRRPTPRPASRKTTVAPILSKKKEVSTPRVPTSHPQEFLNRLSPSDQQKFLDQFSVLNEEQQAYAYNQFLSTTSEVQLHAIRQFLSLDPEVLIVSIQAEIDSQTDSFKSRPQPQIPQQPSINVNQNLSNSRRVQQPRNPHRPRQSEREAFHRQLQLQKLQQEQLQEIIKQQHSINLQGQTIIM